MTYRIGTVMAGLMVAVAILVDGIQFLLTLTVIGAVFNIFVTAFAWTGFFLWFMLRGVNYFDKKGAVKMLTAFASVIVELVPFISALPATTLGVVALIIQTRIEDRKNMNLPVNPANNQALLRKAAERWQRSNLRQAAAAGREAREAGRREES